MALYVNTNVSALSGQKNLMDVTARMNSSFEKLSSGSRINSAKDDAAGLQISDRLTTQITGLNQANRNANDGISIAQIAEGALGEITNNVQRMRQLAVQGGNRTLSMDDRSALGQEFEKLLNVNNDIADRTAYGTLKILNGDSPTSGFQIQSGAFAGEQDTITTGNATLAAVFGQMAADEDKGSLLASALTNTTASTFGTLGKVAAAYVAMGGASAISLAVSAMFGDIVGVSKVSNLGEKVTSKVAFNVSNFTTILTQQADSVNNYTAATSLVIPSVNYVSAILAAASAGTVSTNFTDKQADALHAFATDTLLDTMSSMITRVDKMRAKLGAEQNGLTSVVRNNTTAVVNVSDSRSRIQDTDFASETAELTRNQIIQQAATTILSQANQLPQTALSLLR